MSDDCDSHGLKPSLFYRWQKAFFENGAAAFEKTDRRTAEAQRKKNLGGFDRDWRQQILPRMTATDEGGWYRPTWTTIIRTACTGRRRFWKIVKES